MSFGLSARVRFDAIREAQSRIPRQYEPLKNEQGRALRTAEYFGINTFSAHQMKEKLPKEIYQKLTSTMETGKKLDSEVANVIAHAIKEWALGKGATHFCHWFQPQTGSTAEKHEAFLSFDESQRPIDKFSGQMLIQGEPDASSFPSGGMRTTFEARGYTAWDPSSPVFIMESTNGKTLCVPTVFISYHGDSLDEKTGLLRSIDILSDAACGLLSASGLKGVNRVVATLGVEQEYFLIDRAFYGLRPDLIMSGRTLQGGQPPKGQQLEDHYFGSIPSRVQAFMSEGEFELYKLGVPIKTRHNEVAPSQFEIAPIFEEANVATDHNQLVMEVLRRVALRHGYACLLHEKPFAGVNGSGKHNNWSMAIASSGADLDGQNLLDPGKTPHQNLRFLLVLASVLKGVHRHAGLLRASIASSGNDHRLGANEAPPAIISVFLGEMLSKICNEIETGTGFDANPEIAVQKLGVGKLPEIMRDNTDRNRTSPFAFTGNKFEFRAVGSSSSPAFPVTVLNLAIAEAMTEISKSLADKLKTSGTREAAIFEVLKQVFKETRSVRFEGNNYSEEWVAEAEKRGLLNLRKTPEALKQMISEVSKKLLVNFGGYSEAEFEARYHIRLERYLKNVQIEVDSLRQIIDTQILPSAYGYFGTLAQGVVAAKAVEITPPQLSAMQRLGQLIQTTATRRAALESAVQKAESIQKEEEKANAYAREVSNAMLEVRAACDELEGVISDEFWPLPKYREMLFVS